MTIHRTGRTWAYIGAGLGGVVSIAANVAHSYVPPAGAAPEWQPQPGAVIGAVFWPLALLVAVEIFARIAWPVGHRWAVLRFGGLLPVAAVAAVVSYRHLAGLLSFYGEDALTVAVGPLAVDGLMVMATGALIATGTHRLTSIAKVTAPPVNSASLPGTPAPAEIRFADIKPNAETYHPTPAVPVSARTSRRTPQPPNTATAVARLADKHPDMSTAEIARRLKISDRTVRRHLAERRTTATTLPATNVSPVAA